MISVLSCLEFAGIWRSTCCSKGACQDLKARVMSCRWSEAAGGTCGYHCVLWTALIQKTNSIQGDLHLPRRRETRLCPPLRAPRDPTLGREAWRLQVRPSSCPLYRPVLSYNILFQHINSGPRFQEALRLRSQAQGRFNLPDVHLQSNRRLYGCRPEFRALKALEDEQYSLLAGFDSERIGDPRYKKYQKRMRDLGFFSTVPMLEDRGADLLPPSKVCA